MNFVEIGADEDHVYFLVQSIPIMLSNRIVQIIKNICQEDIQTPYRDKENTLGRQILAEWILSQYSWSIWQ